MPSHKGNIFVKPVFINHVIFKDKCTFYLLSIIKISQGYIQSYLTGWKDYMNICLPLKHFQRKKYVYPMKTISQAFIVRQTFINSIQ